MSSKKENQIPSKSTPLFLKTEPTEGISWQYGLGFSHQQGGLEWAWEEEAG